MGRPPEHPPTPQYRNTDSLFFFLEGACSDGCGCHESNSIGGYDMCITCIYLHFGTHAGIVCVCIARPPLATKDEVRQFLL